MQAMKQLFITVLFILLFTISAEAQEKITDISGQVFYGYIVERTPEYLRFIDEFNSEFKIAAKEIKSTRKLFCEIITNKGKKAIANLGQTTAYKLFFYTEAGEEIIINKLDFGAIILNDRKLTSANWRPLSNKDLILEN